MKILLICYNNELFVQWFPQGIACIVATLLKYNQDIYHYPMEH